MLSDLYDCYSFGLGFCFVVLAWFVLVFFQGKEISLFFPLSAFPIELSPYLFPQGRMSTYSYRTRGEGEGAGHPVDSALSSQTAIYRDHLGKFPKQSVPLQNIHSPFLAILPSDSFKMNYTGEAQQ